MTDEMQFDADLRRHIARNTELVASLAKRGVDLKTPRLIEHHFWAEGHRNGVRLANELYRRGFLLLVLGRVKTEDNSRDLWNVEAELEHSISEAVSTEAVAALIELAARLSCLYDGWGTHI